MRTYTVNGVELDKVDSERVAGSSRETGRVEKKFKKTKKANEGICLLV